MNSSSEHRRGVGAVVRYMRHLAVPSKVRLPEVRTTSDVPTGDRRGTPVPSGTRATRAKGTADPAARVPRLVVAATREVVFDVPSASFAQ